MVNFDLFIPVLSNAGIAFTPEHDSMFEVVLLAHFGGFNRSPGLVSGAWIGQGGFTFRDACRVYTVALDSILEAGKLRGVIDFALAHYDQEAIHLRYLGLSENITK